LNRSEKVSKVKNSETARENLLISACLHQEKKVTIDQTKQCLPIPYHL